MQLQPTGNQSLTPAQHTSRRNTGAVPPDGTTDQVQLGSAKPAPDMAKMARSGAFATRELTEPNPSAPVPRNHEPVLLIHGTRRDKDDVADLYQPTLDSGHPVDWSTYMGIEDGDSLQSSGQAISQRINADRVDVARKNIDQLKQCNGDVSKMEGILSMKGDLYGKPDPAYSKVTALLPGVVSQLDDILKLDPKQLGDSFSLRTKQLQDQLAAKVAATGFAGGSPDSSRMIAAELMDSIAPKISLVGHSMGGFVAYAMALNPSTSLDHDDFHYDGANGIANVVTLSSPVKSGVDRPLPPALANEAGDLYEKDVLNPIEQTPGMQLAMLNPFFASWYGAAKELTHENLAISSDLSSAVLNPLVYAQKPGVEQISDGSDFIKKYIDGKKVPDGITAIALTNKFDGVSVASRSQVDESQPNAFNVDAHVDFPADQLASPTQTKAILAHLMMAKEPALHAEELKTQVLQNPTDIPRLLDGSNYDGTRWDCLSAIQEELQKDPHLFDKPGMEGVLASIQATAAEKMPFTDSPSYFATQILKELHKGQAASVMADKMAGVAGISAFQPLS